MSWIAIVGWTLDGRVAKYADYDTATEAEAHVARHGGFAAERPAAPFSHWLIDGVGRTVGVAAPPSPPEPSYRDQRKAAYLAELGASPGDFVETVGDVLDDLIREVRALAAGPATLEFAALADKIDDIKSRFPKPVAADPGDPL